MQSNNVMKKGGRAAIAALACVLALSQTFTAQEQKKAEIEKKLKTPSSQMAIIDQRKETTSGSQVGHPLTPGDEHWLAAEPNQINWLLTGNAGTVPGMNFLGTTDNRALEVKVSNERALRIEPAADSSVGFSPNLIGGFRGNMVTDGVVGGAIGGGGNAGFLNVVTDSFGTIAGGRRNRAGDAAGTAFDNIAATVGGGSANIASGDHSTVSGGSDNTASGIVATVGGGALNMVSGVGSTAAGGLQNTVSSDQSTVGGGMGNAASGLRSTVGGGFGNMVSGDHATVGGGFRNAASGLRSTVPGGDGNTASGNFSFAAGRSAKANHVGAFVWADAFGTDFASTADNQFNVRASGGARIASNTAATMGVRLAPGGNAWMSLSDRHLKENFTPVDGRAILRQLSLIPITRWNLKSQDPSIWHLGPMAQDFHAAFGLGEDDRYINGSDADGITLVSIQALYQMSVEKDRHIEELQQRIKRLEQMVETLMKKDAR
jgi:hypothetical protein